MATRQDLQSGIRQEVDHAMPGRQKLRIANGTVSRSSASCRSVDACRQVEDLPQALAALDLALWDRAGRREGRPVSALLSDDSARHVPVNATLSALDRAGVAEQAARAVREGAIAVPLGPGLGVEPFAGA